MNGPESYKPDPRGVAVLVLLVLAIAARIAWVNWPDFQ